MNQHDWVSNNWQIEGLLYLIHRFKVIFSIYNICLAPFLNNLAALDAARRSSPTNLPISESIRSYKPASILKIKDQTK